MSPDNVRDNVTVTPPGSPVPLPNSPPTTVSFTAIIADFIPVDLIVGNRAIHDWNLYRYIKHANTIHIKKRPTPLSVLLTQTDNNSDTDTVDHQTTGDTSSTPASLMHQIDGTARLFEPPAPLSAVTAAIATDINEDIDDEPPRLDTSYLHF